MDGGAETTPLRSSFRARDCRGGVTPPVRRLVARRWIGGRRPPPYIRVTPGGYCPSLCGGAETTPLHPGHIGWVLPVVVWGGRKPPPYGVPLVPGIVGAGSPRPSGGWLPVVGWGGGDHPPTSGSHRVGIARRWMGGGRKPPPDDLCFPKNAGRGRFGGAGPSRPGPVPGPRLPHR